MTNKGAIEVLNFIMRPIDAVSLSEEIELCRQSTDQEYELDFCWADGYNAGLDRALHSIAHAKTITPPPNDPLTLEELREMDGEPVWVIFYAAYMETVGMWALVSVEGYTKEVFLTNRLGGRSVYEKAVVDIKAIYRRKPEEGMI